MGIKATTSLAQVHKILDRERARREKVLLRSILYCAEEVTNAARSTNSYRDQTGNLRSSVGSLVIVDGKIVKEYGFELTLSGQQGISDGKEFVHSLVSQYPKGIVIIVVAGKNYASYVSDKGYDVLDSAEELAKTIVPALLKSLNLL